MKKLLISICLLISSVSMFAQTGTGWAPMRAKINHLDSVYFTKELRIAGPWRIGSVTVTASGTELNLLHGALFSTIEANYLQGVSSNVQTQINTKLATADSSSTAGLKYATGLMLKNGLAVKVSYTDTLLMLGPYINHNDTLLMLSKYAKKLNPTFTGTVVIPTPFTLGAVSVTANGTELNVLDNIPVGLTSTELGYVDGVTSAIQTQLNARGRVYSDTMDVSAGVLRTKATTITTEPYSVQIFSSGGKDITHSVSDSVALNGGVYKLYVYSVDALTDTKIKILY